MRDNEQENRETHEAVDDVIESMERFASRHWMHDEGQNVREFAARLKAAWKRDEERAVEHATRHAEAVARDNCRDCVHNPSGKNYEGGNAAAMREALCDIVMLTMKVGYSIHGDVACGIIASKAKYALSKPPRNCDRFADEPDAQLAFLNEVWLISVDRETMLERDKYENWTDEMRKRYGRWLLASAAGRKGEEA